MNGPVEQRARTVWGVTIRASIDKEVPPVMSLRKSTAALAAATAALALAVPAANASAATFGPGPVVHAPIVSPVYTPSAVLCSMLVYQLRAAELAGNHILANAIARTLMDLGCGGAAI